MRFSPYLFNSVYLLVQNLLLMSFVSIQSFATHNRAGEITYRHIQGKTYEFTITTFTEIGNKNADRPVLGIDFGDKMGIDSVQRDSSIHPYVKNNIQKNVYITTHSFLGSGDYTISVLDPNRNANVNNIPNSVDEPFYIFSTLSIGLRNNDSPKLLNPPIAFTCLKVPFYYSPAAWDADGDSLVYSLVPCYGNGGQPIPGYTYPSANNVFAIDPHTGILTWDSPLSVGEFNIAILITEYRRGKTANGSVSTLIVGSVLRDMQITVQENCSNYPPEIDDLPDFCVIAGDSVEFDVFATDLHNMVDLEAFGGPFQIAPKAMFSVTPSINAIGHFFWRTACSHVRKNPYIVTFKATDNGNPPLTNYNTAEIRVIAPAVENLVAQPQTGSVKLSWEREICSQAIGYRIYRHTGPSNFIPGPCQTGIPNGLGFVMINEIDGISKTNMIDDNDGFGLIPGEVYCYRVVAFFEDGAESFVSEEVCAQLKKDIPILTNVSIRVTDSKSGSIYVAWSPPNEHDKVQFPGPYKYRIYRTLDRKTISFSLIDSTMGFTDTVFVDTNLNTLDHEYTYKIEMLDLSTGSNARMGYSIFGTSIYLQSMPKDNKLILHWDESVPWRNTYYEVFRKNTDGSFEYLGKTSEKHYTDAGLTNLKSYCYYVVSYGEYFLSSIARPLINSSQIHCNAPVDNELPCPPKLELYVDDCETVSKLLEENPERCGDRYTDVGQRIDRVELMWTNPNLTCDSTEDVLHYELFYSPTRKGNFQLLGKFFDPGITSYSHQLYNSRAGCYYITAIDSFENISPVVDTVCAENCMLYKLPNVFTPNNDGINDYFRPFPYCYVDEVQFTVFNRWGNVVFRTDDPDILWNGVNISDNRSVEDGVYFYTCIVSQVTLDGIREVELKGVVHILGSSVQLK